jgi:hypothetical protein
MLTRKMFESRVSEMPFPGLWGEILQNSDGVMIRKRHCNTSEVLANIFALQLVGPPFGPLGLGPPGSPGPSPY